jgi:hypothetical protein
MAKRMSTAALACALALGASPAARAQSPGDAVRIETSSGVVEGTLVDRLPAGYLVNKGKASEVVPYAKVRGISRVGPAAAVPAPPAVSAPAVPLPPTPPASLYVPPKHALVDDPFLSDERAPAGTEPPAPPPPPEPLGPPVPAAAPLPPAALPPPPAVMPEVKTHRRSAAVMGVGVGLFGAGVITATIGALVFLGSSGNDYGYGSGEEKMNNGLIAGGVGAAAVAVGITLWSVGAARIPDAEKRGAESEALKPTFAIGPGSASMRVKF